MIACSAILYMYYWLFLRNKRFHYYNRFYLLAATGISIVIPFIKIPVFIESNTTTAQLVNRSIEIISVSRWEDEFSDDSAAGSFASWLTFQNTLMIVYGLIVLVFLYLLCRSLLYIRNLSKKYSYQYINALKFYSTTEPGTPFSFFRSIFWNSNLNLDSKEGQQIFRHELFHVKQRHSADILFIEIVSIAFWINPVFHLIKKEIKAIHEFLADQHALSDTNEEDYAELLILQSINIKKSSISNYFFQNHIKRRIAMITQFKNKKYGYWTRVLVLPLLVLLFCAIALYAKIPDKPIKHGDRTALAKHTVPLTVLIDAGHGGNDAGVSSNEGLQEKDLSLAIARQIKQSASAYNLKIVMTRDEDVSPTLKDRTMMASSIQADMIISIHVGNTENTKQDNGFDIYVTNKNQQTVEDSKILGQSIATQIKSLYHVGPIKQRKEKGIWILDAAHCPAVLIECGYISNERDVAFISDIQNQQKIAKKILDGIVNYQSASQGNPIADTIPPGKKIRDSLNEVRLQREAQKGHDKIEESHREAELAHRRLNEVRAELELKNDALLKKQKELELQHRVIEERNKNILQREMELKQRLSEAEIARKNDILQKEIELKQRLLEADVERKNDALQKLQEELEIKQQKLIETKHAEIEIQNEEHLRGQKRQEMALKQREMLEAKTVEIEKMNKLLMQKQEELELKRLRILEQELEEKEKKSPSSSEKPKPGNSDLKNNTKKPDPASKSVPEKQ